MIPESLRKQTRAIQLSFRKDVHKEKLSPKEETELKVLKAEADIKTKHSIRKMFANLRALDRHQKRTKNLNIGSYSASTRAA